MCGASTVVVGPRKVQQVRSEEDKQPQGMIRAGRRNQGTPHGKLAPPLGGGKEGAATLSCGRAKSGLVQPKGARRGLQRPAAVVSIGTRSCSLG